MEEPRTNFSETATDGKSRTRKSADPEPELATGKQALHAEAYRLLVQAVSDYAIFMLDPEGNIMSWNQGAEHIKGYMANEVIGRHFSIFYPEEDIEAKKPQRELELAKLNGHVRDEDWRVRKNGERFWANVLITAIYDNGQLLGFAKVARDLTERKLTEEKIRRAYGELEKIVEASAASNRELQSLTAQMAGREYRIKELENEVKLLKLRLELDLGYNDGASSEFA